MIYKEAAHIDELEPGDFVVWSNQNYIYYGFYKGTGVSGTIQILHPTSIYWANEENRKPRIDVIFGQAKNWRVIRSHPDFITKGRKNNHLDEALEIIRETKILPVKY
jgi:hypothetical protein